MRLRICLLCFLFINQCSAQSWMPPGEVSAETVKINFEVDSTWHLIKGEIPEVSGKIWLDNKSDPTSIRANLVASVSSFDTDNSSRDKELRHVMDADKFPNVSLIIKGFEGEPCSPIKVEKTGECKGSLKSNLTIRDVSKELSLPYVVRKGSDYYEIKGEFKIKWAEFGVEDPSILIAKLDDTVKVSYSLNLLRSY